jgi:hypothetical protein
MQCTITARERCRSIAWLWTQKSSQHEFIRTVKRVEEQRHASLIFSRGTVPHLGFSLLGFSTLRESEAAGSSLGVSRTVKSTMTDCRL